MKISKAACLLALLLVVWSPTEGVQSSIKDVRFGTNLLSKARAAQERYEHLDDDSESGLARAQGRLLHTGTKITTPATGTCASKTWKDKVVVAARYEEDVSWMATYMHPFLPYLVYSISGDDDATHRTMSNTGREAQAYVQFMVDYYECLPEHMAFIHAHRASAHSPDILSDLKNLKWDSLPGFVSLSRPARHSIFHFHDPDFHKPLEGDETETAHWSQFAYEQNINIKAHWKELFQEEMGEIPEVLQSPNCGQFAVTRDVVYTHPKEFYQKQLQWMQRTSMDPFWAGLIYEHLWSYILGEGTNYTQPLDCTILKCDEKEQFMVSPWPGAKASGETGSWL